MIQQLRLRCYQTGISYMEILVAVMIIAVSAIPVTNALQGGMNSSNSGSRATINHYRMTGRLEEILAESYAVVAAQEAGLTVPTAYSDSAGTTDRRLVFISGYDGDNADADDDPFTGVDAGLLLVRIEIEGSADVLQSLKTEQ